MNIKDKSGQIILRVDSNTLTHAYLRNANLSHANLSHADLSHADLRWADLRNADLRNANLRNADICHANLGGADLEGAGLVVAGLDERGYLFYATGDSESFEIRAGCRKFDSVSEARDHWQSRHLDNPFLHVQCLILVDTLERLIALKGWGKKNDTSKGE